MPPDSHNEQELMLKKRARRRLVGAVALVLLMIVLLPQVLQDRAALARQDPIKIIMQEPMSSPVVPAPVEPSVAVPDETAAPEVLAPIEAAQETASETTLAPAKKPIVDNPVPSKSNSTDAKSTVAKAAEANAPNISSQIKESFTVQVGVYSDATNVERLQEQLKQAGFVTKTEKVKTEKGESIRLKAGSYPNRQDAVVALAKIKELGLPGIVVSQQVQ